MINFDEKFWLALSFLILITLLYKPLKSVLIKLFDERSKSIRDELDEAAQLKEEAEKLLLSFKDKENQLDANISKIIKNAEDQIQIMKEKSQAELDIFLKRKTELTLFKIETQEKEALQAIETKAIDIAFKSIHNFVSDSITSKLSENLIQNSIKQIEKKLH